MYIIAQVQIDFVAAPGMSCYIYVYMDVCEDVDSIEVIIV